MWLKHKRKILISLAVLLPLAALYTFGRAPLTLILMERILVQRMTAAPFYNNLTDGLHLGVCGAGAPLADEKRSGPCLAVVAGKQYFIFDAGTDSPRNLVRMGWQPGLVQAVFLTHFHSDHIDGLGELATLRWVGADHTAPLPVYGAKGVKEIVSGFNQAYRLDSTYRTAHHGEAIAPKKARGLAAKEFTAPKEGEKTLVFEQDGVKIYAFAVAHEPVSPAVGYRIEYKGRAITISGDTKASKNLEKFAYGSDLLAHEALSFKLVKLMNKAATIAGNVRLEKITLDILDYHTDPKEAAASAVRAEVRHLLLYHIVPPLPLSALEEIFLAHTAEVIEESTVEGITLAEDGLLFSLPALVKGDPLDYEEEDKGEIIQDKLF